MPESLLITAALALLALAAAAGYQIGHKHGEAFALRLRKNDVELLRWYADEPKVLELAKALEHDQRRREDLAADLRPVS